MEIKELYQALGGDYQTVLNRMGSESLVKRFVLKFASINDFPELEKAYKEDNKKEVYRLIHSFKGMALSLSLDSFASKCTSFCEKYKINDLSSYDEDVKKVMDEYLKAKELILSLE